MLHSLTAQEKVEMPHSALGLWPIRRASINIGSIILSPPEVGGGLHMRGRRSSTKQLASDAK
jgi:hypothetical protein